MTTKNLILIIATVLSILYSNVTLSQNEQLIRGEINSIVDKTPTGNTSTTFYIKSIGNCTLSNVTFHTNANNLTFQSNTNLNNYSIIEGDSLAITLNLNYDFRGRSRLPNTCEINIPYNYVDTIYNTQINDTAKIKFHTYFSPDGTLEIWNIEDFLSLPRRWFSESDSVSIPLIKIASIPESNIDFDNFIIPDSTVWENDNWDNWREVEVPGLAYNVLMMPVPNDSLSYYNNIGDGQDSLVNTKGTTFNVNITGKLTSTLVNEAGDVVEIPLTGIRVIIYDDDGIYNQILDKTYTDDMGNYSFNFTTNQSFEGSSLELFIRIKSKTNDEYRIEACRYDIAYTKDFNYGSYNVNTTSDTYNICLNQQEDDKYDLFRGVHWCNNGYKYFKNNNVVIPKGLKIKRSSGESSYYTWVPLFKAIHIHSDRGMSNRSCYHEFGHHVQHAFGAPLFALGPPSHTEYTIAPSRFAFCEGWAEAVSYILQSAYYDEGIGYENFSYIIDEFESPYYFCKGNGIRNEGAIGYAIYDLWDGGMNLPNIVNAFGETLCSYDDNYTPKDMLYPENVELFLYQICQPIINEGSDCKNVIDYYNYLIDNAGINYYQKSQISRVFRENGVQFDATESTYHKTNLSSDDIYIIETFEEDVIPSYEDTYHVNFYNKHSVNSINLPGATTSFPITDELHIGIFDPEESNEDKVTDFTFNGEFENSEVQNSTYEVYGITRTIVQNGTMELGSSNTYAQVIYKKDSKLQIGQNGTLIVNPNCEITINEDANFCAAPDATIIVKGNGRIILKNGSFSCIDFRANIVLEDVESRIIIENEALVGLNDIYINDAPQFYGPDPWYPVEDIIQNHYCMAFHDIPYTGLGSVELDKCLNFSNYEIFEDLIINEDTEIDYYRCIVNDEVVFHYSEYLDMNANIIINPDATLVLSTYCSIRFNEGFGIIIQPGGKLIINNASISNRFIDCGYWNGIEVLGNADSPQTEEFQGTVYINNSTLTRAKKSIFAHCGAIVKCNNTSFYNNNMHIKFDSYHNYPFPEQMPTYEKSNISSFTDCNFTLTSSYINHSNNEQDVNLYDVNGIVFAGCTFNKSEDLNNLDFIRQGILSCMASFTVKSSCTEPIFPCPNSTPSTFNNYDYSISSLGNSRNQIQVKDASFNKCKKGIYFLVVDNFKVINNTFQIVGDDVSSDYPPYGIYIDGGSDVFTLEGNTFGRLVSSGGSSAGVVVRDNHGANNTVYRNTFNNLRTSVHAIGENRGGANGLKITCNNFNSSRYDISTYSDESDANSGIAPYQGSITKDAGNEFSINTKIFHIWNGINCNSTNYYYSPDWISNSRLKPVSTYNTVKVLSTYMNSCPDNTGSGIIVIKSYLDITKTQIDSIAETLDNIVDGGNTSSTVAEIVLANDITAWETYISLIEKSPNLSIESLKEVASKETSLTAPMVRDVLVSNPQAAKSKEIEIILYERIDQLPDYMLEQIAMGVADMSPKEYLELKQNVLISEFDQQISTGLEQLLLSDDMHIHDSIVSWLNYANTDLWKLHLVSYYKSKKMYPEAINCLQQIENQASMSEIYDIQSQISFYDQLQIWNNSSKSLINLQEADINFLTNFYYGDESSKSYYLAKVLLVANGEVSIDDRVYETPIMETRNTKQSILFDDNNMIIYPNPVTSFCTISYNITGIDSDYILVIADENGKILKEMQLKYSKDQIILNVANLKSGTYTCSIKVGGQFKFSEKIIKI